jgi:hypothetical protein
VDVQPVADDADQREATQRGHRVRERERVAGSVSQWRGQVIGMVDQQRLGQVVRGYEGRQGQ